MSGAVGFPQDFLRPRGMILRGHAVARDQQHLRQTMMLEAHFQCLLSLGAFPCRERSAVSLDRFRVTALGSEDQADGAVELGRELGMSCDAMHRRARGV